MTSTVASIPVEERTTRENPWPGLRSYDEEEQDFFYGRPTEALGLLRLVKRDVLTVFFGISGIGKTSLLKAGLFPRLREEGFLPVRLRLEFADRELDFARDAIRDFETQVSSRDLQSEHTTDLLHAGASVTLWEYFHRLRVWDHADLLTPVLVFDQFEEVFTLGAGQREAGAVSAFLIELADLVENQIPIAVRRRIEESRQPLTFNTDAQPYRVILSLREDYLANLEGLVPRMSSLSKRNRFRLLPMTGEQALEAILRPGAQVIAAPEARKIVDALGFTRQAATRMTIVPVAEDTWGEQEIEPFLLSLVCRELNSRRQDRGLPMISSELVAGTQGGVQSILSTFYERCFVGLPPVVRVFVEDQLVGKTGYRQRVALEDLQDVSDVHTAIQVLVTRRLLRVEEDRHGVARVELTHDVLTPIAVTSRNGRLVAEKAAQAWEEHRVARRRRLIGWLAFLLMIAVGGFGVAVWQWVEATQARHMAEAQLRQVQEAQQQAQEAQQQAQEAQQQAQEAREQEQEAQQRVEDLAQQQPEVVNAQRRSAALLERGNLIEPEMVDIPAGTFRMGDSRGEKNEQPVREVHTQRRFAISRYEITFEQYDLFATSTGKKLPDDGGWGRGRQPVINISWNDAQDYAAWLSRQTGKRYRLPTEAEWEYAARAGTETAYWWGNDVGRKRANCKDCGSGWDYKQTAPIGSFQPNSFGLYDTAGNVWEWVQDCWHENYNGAPTDGSAWRQEDGGNCGFHVIRGGSWSYPSWSARSSRRGRDYTDRRTPFVGLRLAQDIE